MNKTGKAMIALAASAAVIFGGVYLFTSSTKDIGKSSDQISSETAEAKLEKMVSKIKVTEGSGVSSPLTDELNVTLEDVLPDLTEDTLTIKGDGDVDIMIWSSPEKAGEDNDAWLVDLITEFNKANHTTEDGKSLTCSLRSISSGLANDYIVSDKVTEKPDLYTPSSAIWGAMLTAEGANISTVEEVTVGNVAGLFIKKDVYKTLEEKYKNVNMQTIVEATAAGEISTGYTNPYTSTTGLNFLVTTLANYDNQDLLSDTAVEGFKKFQEKVPYVATTSNQMVEAAENGSFDVFVGEAQQYENNASYKSNYEFVPFGVRHDNPVYNVSGATEGIDEVKAMLESAEAQELANKYGFNTYNDYKAELTMPDGSIYLNAQKLWRTEKDSEKTVVAFFIADLSGSMDGQPLLSLQDSLLKTMTEITSDAYVGLITYNDYVEIAMPLSQFDLNSKAIFKGAIEGMEATGSTATNNAILVALQQIKEFKEENPDMNISPKIILLSDGAQNVGYSYNDVEQIIQGMKVPIYTIGYNYDGYGSSLKALSDINEAATLNADNEDIVTKLRDLFRINL